MKVDLKSAQDAKALSDVASKAASAAQTKAESDAKAAVAKAESGTKAALDAKSASETELAAVKSALATANTELAKWKPTTITCVRGKTVKKVSAVNPMCPTGYEKK